MDKDAKKPKWKWKGNEIVLKVISYTQNSVLVQKLSISHWPKSLRNALVIDGFREKNRDDSEEE